MNMKNRNVTYSTIGDYQLPNLTLSQPKIPLGKYGRMRRTYLMNHRPVLYNTMLLNGSLYRKSGYSKAFLEAHREEITLHKAAKTAFDEAGLQKLPKVKELDAEFAELLTKTFAVIRNSAQCSHCREKLSAVLQASARYSSVLFGI